MNLIMLSTGLWNLQITLAPAEAEFSRKIAFVTGGAGGIGSVTCRSWFLKELTLSSQT